MNSPSAPLSLFLSLSLSLSQFTSNISLPSLSLPRSFPFPRLLSLELLNFKMSTSPGTGTIILVCSQIGSATSRLRCVSIHRNQFNFLNGTSQIVLRPRIFRRQFLRRRNFRPSASWIATSQIASQAFTWGTIAVLPFYTLMVFAPNAKLTRRTMESNAPYVILGCLYAYLLYLSWTPETLRCMFASKYWLPELSGIARMFTNEMTVASAWIHLLAVDLFAARQVFYDGLRNNVETRHSISLCLLFCPIGIIAHAITKVLTESVKHQY